MYNLLIVDDELVISKYIAEVFRNSEMMGDILLDVQHATSGFDALDIMEEGYIDIVLTDISMPGMSGIELMERIKRKWPNVKVILMSVYDEFQYVQAAIRNNSVDYLLKSEGEEQLIASVKKAVDELEQELRSEEIVKKAAQNLKLANAVLRERIIIDMIEGEKQNLETLKDYFDEIDMPLDISRQTFMIIGKVTMPDMAIITNAKLYKIKAFVEEHLKRNMSCASAIYERRLILLLQHKNETDITKGTINFMINQLYRIQRILSEMLNVDISFSTDQYPLEWSKIDIKYEHLNSALVMMSSMTTDIILIESHRDEYSRCTQNKDGNEVEEVRLAIRQLETLGIYFTDGKKEGFLELYDSLMRIFRNLSPQYDTVKYEAVYILASQFLAAVNKLSISDRNKLAGEIISKVKKYENWNEIETYFRNIAEQMFQARDEEAFTSINRVIDFISKYAMEHLNEDLSLNRFAKLLHYHPSYLSRLFKQATGTAFSDYIAEIRLNKAKNMLCKGDMKITNIALELGFKNASYFTRFFKKYTGLAPQEYKNAKNLSG